MTDENKNKATLQRKAYGQAMTRLRETHREEFNAFMQAEAKGLGLDWKPKPTDEEKAADQLAALLAAHPHLREQMNLPAEAGPSEDFSDFKGGTEPSTSTS